MTFDFRYPQLTGATEKEQLQQMKTYIHQLVDELKWALNSVESPQNNVVVVRQNQRNANSGIGTIGMDELDEDSVQAHFNEIKPLIIKSADIVNAYYEEINKRLESLYVAQSEFGTFVQQATQEIEATADNVTQVFTNVQTIATDVGTVKTEVETIDTKVKTVESNVGTLDTEVKEVKTGVQTITEEVGKVDTELKGVKTEVQTVTQEVSKVDTELKDVKTGVQAVEQKAQAIEGNVQTIGSNVETIGSNVQEIETDLQDTKVGIDSTIGRIADEVGVIDKDLQGVKAGVESGIKDLSDEVGKVDSKIEDAKSAINSDLDKLKDSLKDLNLTLVEVNAHIKSGLLYYDNEIPVYGLEIGQKNTINGVETFNKFARFCAGKLSFYDNNGTEVAYISDYKLYITHAEVTGTLKLGGYLVDTSRGVTFKWVGRS